MSLSKSRLNIMVFSLIMVSCICSVFTFTGLNLFQTNPLVSAQISNSNAVVMIINTSTYTDELGNFHIIGEVNNTSAQSQTAILITAILSDTINNTVVGNHSVFSSISTLRQGELSPFDIVIQNPQQILGKFDFIEFATASQPAAEEKPANLVINGSSSFLDTAGNPHIIGNIINQGQTPEQFLNLVATFYDNSSLGVIGTQTFGLNVGNLTYNQMAPFDITITDNKTKSEGAFYSLNIESTQSSIDLPINSKISFASTGGFTGNNRGEGFTNSLVPPSNNQPGFATSSDDDSGTRDNYKDNDDNQRGEKKTDDEGNPWFDDENCSEEPGSSGGSSSECEEAEREEQSEAEDEDSLEKDQGPPANSDSDSTNDNNDEGENNEDENDDRNEDKDAESNQDNGDDNRNEDKDAESNQDNGDDNRNASGDENNDSSN